MKWFIRILVVLAVVIAGLLWFGYSKIDDLLKMGIEKAGTEALQAPVTIQKLKISMLSGAGTIEGLEIGTPTGFSVPCSLRINQADIAINTAASEEDRIVIQHIRLNEPDIHLEVGPGGTNLSQIAKNARATADSVAPSSGESPAPTSRSKPEKEIKLQVDELLITGAKVNASAGVLPGAQASVTLPEIKLTGLGAGPEGLTPAELTAVILSKLSEEATKAGAGGAIDNLLKGSNIKVDSKDLKKSVKELKKLFGK